MLRSLKPIRCDLYLIFHWRIHSVMCTNEVTYIIRKIGMSSIDWYKVLPITISYRSIDTIVHSQSLVNHRINIKICTREVARGQTLFGRFWYSLFAFVNRNRDFGALKFFCPSLFSEIIVGRWYWEHYGGYLNQ